MIILTDGIQIIGILIAGIQIIGIQIYLSTTCIANKNYKRFSLRVTKLQRLLRVKTTFPKIVFFRIATSQFTPHNTHMLKWTKWTNLQNS